MVKKAKDNEVAPLASKAAESFLPSGIAELDELVGG
jgi:hypothetical protein